jgi:hypothetical protein
MDSRDFGLKRLRPHGSLLTAVLLALLAAPVGCDNDELTEHRALYVFGTESSPYTTWTDPTSGLTWQVTPTGGTMSWSEAKAHCAGLSLDGGGWRLPKIGELRSLIRGCPATELGSETCKVEEGGCLDSTCNDGDLCEYCPGNDGPADGCYWPDEMQGECSWRWSSSPVEDYGDIAWSVYFSYGDVYNDGVTNDINVRCVR